MRSSSACQVPTLSAVSDSFRNFQSTYHQFESWHYPSAEHLASQSLWCSPGKAPWLSFSLRRFAIQRNFVNKWTNNWTQRKQRMEFTDKKKVSESVRPSSLCWAKGTPIFLRLIIGIYCWFMSMSPVLSCVFARRVQLVISIGQFVSLAANGAVGPLSRIGFLLVHFGMSGWSWRHYPRLCRSESPCSEQL